MQRARAWVVVAGALAGPCALAAACSGAPEAPRDGGPDLLAPPTDAPPREASRAREEAGAREAGDSATDTAPDAGRDAGPPPSLAALTVSGPAPPDSSLPPVLLSPPFSPTVHDYYVRCSAGENALTVSMVASPGAETLLVRPIVSASLPAQTLAVGVTEGAALVAAATSAAGTVEYWIRCLPRDFPTFSWVPHPDAGAAPPGYYLLGVARPPPLGDGAYAFILDGHGVPVWYAPSPSPGGAVFNVGEAVDGAVSYQWVPLETSFEIRELDPPAVSQVAAAGLPVDEHELVRLPSGNFVALSTPMQAADLTGLTSPLYDGGSRPLGPETILGCTVLELAPDGTVVWSWQATDHIDPVEETTWAEHVLSYYDVFHCNSIDVDPATGNLLLSARQTNALYYIDKASGAVLWKMGGRAYSKDGAALVSVSDPFVCQHDARLVGWVETCAGGSGQVTVFDDETNTWNPARGVVYDVAVGGGGDGGCEAGATDGAAGVATVAWQYAGATPSQAMGSFRIGADGSRVIGWGEGAGPPKGFTEVDVGHDALLDFAFTNGDVSYRAIKVPLGAYDLDVLRRTAGLP